MKKTKAFYFLIALILLCFSTNVTALAAGNIKVLVDGNTISFDQPPVIVNDRVLVPMRAIFESLGYKVTWDEHLQKAIATKETVTSRATCVATIPLRTLFVVYTEFDAADTSKSKPINKVSFIIALGEDFPVRIMNGRTLLPTRAVAEALGCKVDWDGEQRTVTINTSNSKIVEPLGWIDKLEAHYKLYAPEQLSTIPDLRRESANNQTSQNPVTPITEPENSQEEQKAYMVFDRYWNKEFQYDYINPPVSGTAPVVGSVPAKIVLDENESKDLFIDNPSKPLEPFRNVTDCYYGGFTYGGCEWYAGGRFWEVYGIPFPHFDKFVQATNLLDEADQYQEFLTIRDVNDVRANSIVVRAEIGNKNIYGHVAFVEYVERDSAGKPVNVYYTEANGTGSNNGKYDYGVDGQVKKESISVFLSHKKSVIGYIIPNPEFYK